MILYNGLNLLVDLLIFASVALWFHGVGYRKAKSKYQPPF